MLSSSMHTAEKVAMLKERAETLAMNPESEGQVAVLRARAQILEGQRQCC